MANPTDETTIINIKSVSLRAWDRARKAAKQRGEVMGEWASRAFEKLADTEAGDQLILPAKPGANLTPDNGFTGPAPGITAGELADLMRGIAALATASGTPPPKVDLFQVYGLADELVRDARGVPRKQPPKPRIAGKAAGQALLEGGKTE